MIVFGEEWKRSPDVMRLHEDEVHIWMVGLEQPDDVVERLAATLAADEQGRAARFYFEHLRREYYVARGVLRNILSKYLLCKPESLEFVYSEKGKPGLSVSLPATQGAGIKTGVASARQADQNTSDGDIESGEEVRRAGQLRFNLSHSGKVAIYAVTLGREVGIDIEAVRKLDDLNSLARSNFSAAENSVLRSLPPALQHEGFFNCWTRKEAYIKALGDGLSYPLDQFDVTLKPGEMARLLKVVGHPEESSRWRLEALKTAEGYIAAVIAEGQDWTRRLWRWESK